MTRLAVAAIGALAAATLGACTADVRGSNPNCQDPFSATVAAYRRGQLTVTAMHAQLQRANELPSCTTND